VDAFLPYISGFFDGEGSIGIYRNGNTNGRALRVQLTQNVTPDSTELLRECRERWGGSMALMNRSAKRPAWNWQVSSSNGVRALMDMRPWLRLKAAEADLVLRFWDQRTFARRDSRGRFLPLSAEIRLQAEEVEAALRAAKRLTHPEFIRQLLVDGSGARNPETTFHVWGDERGQLDTEFD
jgi:hypothetical protein